MPNFSGVLNNLKNRNKIGTYASLAWIPSVILSTNVHPGLQGKRFTKQGALPSFGSILGALDLNNFWQLVDKMAKTVPLAKPWSAAQAHEWDRMTFQEFINKKCWTK